MNQTTADRTARIDAILAHPRFAEARRLHIDGYLALYSGDSALNKLLVEGARHVIFTFVVSLTAGHRDDDPMTWLTLGRLQDVVSTYQVGSPGLVEALVTRMIDRGLLTSKPAPFDRRKRILQPTEALLSHDRGLVAAQAAPCLVVANSTGLVLAAAHDPVFHQRLRISAVESFADAMVLLQSNPEIVRLFVARDSGLMALYMVLESALASPSGTLSTVPYQAIADRFGVSRTHVRDLIADAEQAGLLVASPDGGGAGVKVLPALWPHVDGWIAGCMELFAECCDRAHLQTSAANAQ